MGKSFLEMLISNTEAKLGRKLYTDEIDFLRWVSDRHAEDKRFTMKCIS